MSKEEHSWYRVSVWKRANLFDPATIKKSTTITKWQRIKLFFRPAKWSVDSDNAQTTVTKYKTIGNVAFILSVRHTPNNNEVQDE